MRFCTNCGRQLEDSALFCPSCGTRTTAQTAQATAPPPQPAAPYPMLGVPPTFGEADRYALSKLYLAAIVMLIGLIAGYALDFGSGLFFAFSFIGHPNAPPTNLFEVFRSSGFLVFASIAAVIGGATELIYLAELRLGLKSLSGVDRPNFGTPSKLTLLALITVPFVFLGVVIEFVGLIPFLATINPSQPPVTPPAQLPAGLGYILVGGAISGIAGIAAIVGLIGGAILGVWRMGSRYNESIFKIGAILFVFPFVNIVAAILFILGVGSARKKLPLT